MTEPFQPKDPGRFVVVALGMAWVVLLVFVAGVIFIMATTGAR